MTALRVIHGDNIADPAGEPPAEAWLMHAEAAKYLRISENKLREMRRAWAAEHPGQRIWRLIGARSIRFSREDLDQLSRWWDAHVARRLA